MRANSAFYKNMIGASYIYISFKRSSFCRFTLFFLISSSDVSDSYVKHCSPKSASSSTRPATSSATSGVAGLVEEDVKVMPYNNSYYEPKQMVYLTAIETTMIVQQHFF